MKILPSDNSYTTFCSLMTGNRSFAVIREAVRSGIIELVGEQACSSEQLVATTGLQLAEGERFIELLLNIGILERYDGLLYLSGFARSYLFSQSPDNQLGVLAFEPCLMERWDRLDQVLRNGQAASVPNQPDESYRERLVLYQQAMHEAALIRSRELWDALTDLPASGLIIDVGAGDGTYLREFLRRYPGWRAMACDLAEVLELNGPALANAGIEPLAYNILDPTEREAVVAKLRNSCSLLLMSNLIHCYSESENRAIIAALGQLLTDNGLLVIHDFFRDGNSMGALYDIHMLVNTYNGRSYSFDETSAILQQAGFSHSSVIPLPSCSHAMVASRQAPVEQRRDPLFQLRRAAQALGFFATAPIDPTSITSEPWVRAKCAYGCPLHGKKWSCPPHSMDSIEFRELLQCYSSALLVAGQAPLKQFQERLLELEKVAFLNGHPKALVFTGGPCCWCDECPDDRCLFPEKRRPSLESCGCDVFALAESAGIRVAPLKNSDDFVQFIGLLLVE